MQTRNTKFQFNVGDFIQVGDKLVGYIQKLCFRYPYKHVVHVGIRYESLNEPWYEVEFPNVGTYFVPEYKIAEVDNPYYSYSWDELGNEYADLKVKVQWDKSTTHSQLADRIFIAKHVDSDESVADAVEEEEEEEEDDEDVVNYCSYCDCDDGDIVFKYCNGKPFCINCAQDLSRISIGCKAEIDHEEYYEAVMQDKEICEDQYYVSPKEHFDFLGTACGGTYRCKHCGWMDVFSCSHIEYGGKNCPYIESKGWTIAEEVEVGEDNNNPICFSCNSRTSIYTAKLESDKWFCPDCCHKCEHILHGYKVILKKYEDEAEGLHKLMKFYDYRAKTPTTKQKRDHLLQRCAKDMENVERLIEKFGDRIESLKMKMKMKMKSS